MSEVSVGRRNVSRVVLTLRRRRRMWARLMMAVEIAVIGCFGIALPVVVWFVVWPQFPDLAKALWTLVAMGWILTLMIHRGWR